MAQSKSNFWRTTQKFISIFSSANKRLISDIKEDLEEIQNSTTYKLTAIHRTDIKSLKKLRKALLKDTNHLRLSGYPELALIALEAARNLNITSPELEVGRANSLAALDQHEKAIQIWQSQSSCNKLKIRDQAVNAIKIYEQNRYQASNLLHALKATLDLEKIDQKYLPKTAPENLAILEYPVINEAIELRKTSKNELSLKILSICSEAGLNSDVINDNKARALFNMGQKRDAIHIWQSLLSSKNEEVKDSAQKILSRLSKTLLASVKKSITNNYLPIHHLPDETPDDLSILGICILKEAIQLRKDKHEELSLQILETTTSSGFETDAINENRARALISIDRNVDAIELLKELQSSRKQKIKESADRILLMMGENLILKLKGTLAKNSWQIHYLSEKSHQPIQKLENLILKETIEMRKQKHNKLSLEILDLTVKAGLKTDRIEDNRARALVNLEQYSEAVSIWNTLKNCKNTKIKESAEILFERFKSQGLQQKILNEVDNTLNSKNGQAGAIRLLTKAILQNPSDRKLHERLGQVAIMNENEKSSDSHDFVELAIHKQSLAGFEAFITALEQQQMPTLESIDETKADKRITQHN